MIFSNLKNSFVSAAASLVLGGAAKTALADPVKNIVLVHGAWVDGSGWKPFYEILTKDGYDVTMVQEPLTSLQDDVAATKRILDLQTGPCILVGHSYGGSIITEAGIDPHVVGLVYVAAHAPDVGEDEGALGKRMLSATQKQEGAVKKTADGFTFLAPADFYKGQVLWNLVQRYNLRNCRTDLGPFHERNHFRSHFGQILLLAPELPRNEHTSQTNIVNRDRVRYFINSRQIRQTGDKGHSSLWRQQP